MYNYQGYTPSYLQGYRDYQTQQLQNPQSFPQFPQRLSGLQGKMVDSIDVVKAQEITLDGTINYFPLADGSAIVTKQLQNDGTSKIIVYKPIEEEKTQEEIKYITSEELEQKMSNFNLQDIKDIKDEIKQLKRQFEDYIDDNSKTTSKKEK